MSYGVISPQLFDYAATVVALVLLEGLLSTDNALVLAVLARDLPVQDRKRALRYGLVGAFVFRAVGILFATWLIRLWYLKAGGAAWLLFLSIRHFIRPARSKRAGAAGAPGSSFWRTVLWVELMDIAFSIDSILAAVAMSNNIYVIYIGGILGIIAMRLVAGVFLKLLDRFPGLETAAYLLIAWIGIKLGAEVYATHWLSPEGAAVEAIPKWLFWTVMVLLLGGGMVFSRPAHKQKEDAAEKLPERP